MFRKYLAGIVLVTAVISGTLHGPGLWHWWRTPPKPKTPEQRNQTQLVALAEYRDLYEAFASGNQSLEAQVRATGVSVKKIGTCWQFRWPIPAGEMAALFGCNPVLYFCPNGDADLPPGFWDSAGWHAAQLRIDRHWVAAQENCG